MKTRDNANSNICWYSRVAGLMIGYKSAVFAKTSLHQELHPLLFYRPLLITPQVGAT